MEFRSRTQGIAYWVTTVLTALLFAAPGIGDVIGLSHFVAESMRLGYPSYFLPFLGVWKILGGVAILLPRTARLKEWAYAGMMFDISGALTSRIVVGDPVPMIIVPCVLAALVLASWALRPQQRRLMSPDVRIHTAAARPGLA